MENFDIWDPQNEIVLKIYEKDNYEIYDTGADSDICYIFFSSNGLYYPNTREIFEKLIVDQDRYEWKWVVKNSSIPNIAGRIIYMRDIYKQWYSRGINKREDTIDKTLKRLEELTKGYRIVTVGSSAGGYMAVLTAIKLKAEYCFNFSGQYQIPANLGNPYFDLCTMLQNYAGRIFYFLPAHCEADRKEYKSVQDVECVKAFLFNDCKHAATMLTGNISYIIDRKQEDLLLLFEKNDGKEINKILFLFQTVPFCKIFAIMMKEVKGFCVRRMGRKWNDV